ncbi:MAG: hypothetical protein HY295_00615 [Thaumarchaeota archaeon]|nr:hypothetical protein [Nitrososphaerota archaeon]
MKVIDVIDPQRVSKIPDKTIVLLSSGNYVEQGVTIKRVQLCLYIQKTDPERGLYSLITSVVETDKGEVEMTYYEGYRGKNALEEAAAFLTSTLGLSGLILRSVIQLNAALNKNHIT